MSKESRWDWHHLGRAESGPPLAGKPNSIKTQGPGTTWVIALHKRLSRFSSGRWMEFGLPMGEVSKETPSRFENHNPFGKGMIAGKATGRWTSASDFQSYCPLKNVGSLRGKRSYTFSVKKPAAHGFFTLSVHGVMFAYTTHTVCSMHIPGHLCLKVLMCWLVNMCVKHAFIPHVLSIQVHSELATSLKKHDWASMTHSSRWENRSIAFNCAEYSITVGANLNMFSTCLWYWKMQALNKRWRVGLNNPG